MRLMDRVNREGEKYLLDPGTLEPLPRYVNRIPKLVEFFYFDKER